MIQDDIFRDYEGDNWFARNKMAKICNHDDMITSIIKQLKLDGVDFVEVGCSNGYRLEKLRKEYCPSGKFVGFDISNEAIQDGLSRYNKLNLYVKSLAEITTDEQFDIVICNFVLHWIDRKTLLQSITAMDKLVRDGGYLIIGDFFPDFNQKRRYHHIIDQSIYTYKQNYPQIFIALGYYREIFRCTFNHDENTGQIAYTISQERASCSVLKKMKNDDFYMEV